MNGLIGRIARLEVRVDRMTSQLSILSELVLLMTIDKANPASIEEARQRLDEMQKMRKKAEDSIL